MKSTYVGTRSANVGDIRCLFALASDSTNARYFTINIIIKFYNYQFLIIIVSWQFQLIKTITVEPLLSNPVLSKFQLSDKKPILPILLKPVILDFLLSDRIVTPSTG